MGTTLHCSFSTKACGLAIFLKATFASSNVAFAKKFTPSLETQVAHEEIRYQSKFLDHAFVFGFLHTIVLFRFVKILVISPLTM
jgi:hypothetical protein